MVRALEELILVRGGVGKWSLAESEEVSSVRMRRATTGLALGQSWREDGEDGEWELAARIQSRLGTALASHRLSRSIIELSLVHSSS